MLKTHPFALCPNRTAFCLDKIFIGLATGLAMAALSLHAQTPPASPEGVVETLYHTGKNKQVHTPGCMRYEREAKMPQLEVREVTLEQVTSSDDLVFCSKCRGDLPQCETEQIAKKFGNCDTCKAYKQAEMLKKIESQYDPTVIPGPLVSVGPDGKLQYKPYTDRGDTIIDFSYAGYQRSEKPIPYIEVKETVSPATGEVTQVPNMAYPKGPDSRERIQAALDHVGALEPDANGFRGAVLLKPGTYHVDGELKVGSGVVLRGSGDGEGGTTLIFSNAKIGIQVGETDFRGSDQVNRISEDYVPAGSFSFTLEDTPAFQVGDTISVQRTPNERWVKELGMDRIKGKPWKPHQYKTRHIREVMNISGNTVTVDAPLPQTFAQEYGGGNVRPIDISNSSMNCGVESLCVQSNYDTTIKSKVRWNEPYLADEENTLSHGIRVSAVNAWVRNCTIKHTSRSGVIVNNSLYVTVRDCKSIDPVSVIRGGRRYSFSNSDSSMSLFYRCYAENGRHDYAGGSRDTGPNAFVLSEAKYAHSVAEPHQRWATGYLFDNIITDHTLQSTNRGNSGSGHGWAGANVVFWNCGARSILVMNPPTPAQNFSIGFRDTVNGNYMTDKPLEYARRNAAAFGIAEDGNGWFPVGHATIGDGYIESPNAPVDPASLFKAQLIERIGPEKAAQVLE